MELGSHGLHVGSVFSLSPVAVAVVDFVTPAESMRLLREKLGATAGERRHYQVLVRVIADKNEAVKAEYVTHHASVE